MDATNFISTLKSLSDFEWFLTAYAVFHNVFECPVCMFDPQRQRLYDDKLHVATRYSPLNVTIGTPPVACSNYKCREFCNIIQCLFRRPASEPRARKVDYAFTKGRGCAQIRVVTSSDAPHFIKTAGLLRAPVWYTAGSSTKIVTTFWGDIQCYPSFSTIQDARTPWMSGPYWPVIDVMYPAIFVVSPKTESRQKPGRHPRVSNTIVAPVILGGGFVFM